MHFARCVDSNAVSAANSIFDLQRGLLCVWLVDATVYWSWRVGALVILRPSWIANTQVCVLSLSGVIWLFNIGYLFHLFALIVDNQCSCTVYTDDGDTQYTNWSRVGCECVENKNVTAGVFRVCNVWYERNVVNVKSSYLAVRQGDNDYRSSMKFRIDMFYLVHNILLLICKYMSDTKHTCIINIIYGGIVLWFSTKYSLF